MEAGTYATQFWDTLELISKSYDTKYSKRAFCAYQKLGETFWSAKFFCGSFLVDGQLKIADFANKAEGYVRAIFDDLFEKRATFLTSAMTNDGGFLPYLMNHWEDIPLEAGMAYLCKSDYDGARRCFELAEKTQCIWQKSIGKPGRYLHLIFIDYCKAMQSNIEWTDALVVNGFPVNSTITS